VRQTSEKREEALTLPWEDWLTFAETQELGDVESGANAVVTALHALHKQRDLASTAIKILQKGEGSLERVVAVRGLEPGELFLPPCVPMVNRDLPKIVHPLRIHAEVISKPGEKAECTEQRRSYYVNPEWKALEAKDPSALMAECGMTVGGLGVEV
jgi:hypothetical protein